MATGMRIPVSAGTHGGFSIVSGDANDSKTILAALGSDDNENAFQQNIGLGDGMIFSIADQPTRNLIQRRIVDVFRRFESQKRYILRPETIKWVENAENQTFELTFKYVNIESDEEKLFRQNFNSSSRGLINTRSG